MNPCADQKENLMLYVYGEMDSGDVKGLENHLKDCGGCRQERERLVKLLGKIEEATDPPELSPQKVQSLAKKITRTLENEREIKWWHKYLDFRTSRIKPAFAVACILLLTFATVRYLNLENGNDFQTSSSHKDVQLAVSDEDLEILQNLELLKAMETIHKLTNVVDPGDDVQSQRESKHERRRMRRNGFRKAYT
jgi:hypothetical protein